MTHIKKCALYPRQFRLIMPITSENIIRDVERKMSNYFGGVTEIPLTRGWWLDNQNRLIQDDNIILMSVRDYAEVPHPYILHKKDEEFMHNLAKEIGEKTNQEVMFSTEDMVAKCNFIPIEKHSQLKKLNEII